MNPREENSIEWETKKGTVGLTLSGGGAKGFAHIGVLHLIDSLGIKVDYIAGTSMGAIVGALYASGYSAHEIEKLVLGTDWDEVFYAKPGLSYIPIRQRYNAGKAIVEIPIEGKRIMIGTGAIEGQQLWNLLSDLFFHTREIYHFSDYPIPFACVATNVGTGEQVVMSAGDIVSALRASMAIPAVFSSVIRDEKKLIDGGVSNNFPVNVVKEMGADYVIGVNTAQGLRAAEELRTPVDIIYQMGFYQDAYMFRVNREFVNLYMAPCLNGYNAYSFAHAKELIEAGKAEARKYLHVLDSLPKTRENMVRDTYRTSKVVLDTFLFEGLDKIKPRYLKNMTRFQRGDTLDAQTIHSMINLYYATGFFERITYSYSTCPHHTSTKTLVIRFEEKSNTMADLGIHFNSFTGVGINLGLQSNKLFHHNLSYRAKVRIGEKPALVAGLNFFLGDKRKTWISVQGTSNLLEFPVYEDFRRIASYRQNYNRLEVAFNYQTGANSYLTIGTAKYHQSIKPTVQTDYMIRGRNSSSESFLEWKRLSIDRHAFPRKGRNSMVRFSYFYGQHPKIRIQTRDNEELKLEDVGITIQDFGQLKFHHEAYYSLGSRSSYFVRLQGGYNINYKQGFINMFNLGGTHPYLRDQVPFAGLSEYEILSPSVLAAYTGMHYNIWSQFYIAPSINAAIYNFDATRPEQLGWEHLILGTGLGLGYSSPIGPIEVTFSYSPQANKVLTYITLGWSL